MRQKTQFIIIVPTALGAGNKFDKKYWYFLVISILFLLPWYLCCGGLLFSYLIITIPMGCNITLSKTKLLQI